MRTKRRFRKFGGLLTNEVLNRSARRSLKLEPLEKRLMFSGQGVAWGHGPDLTISFAPDGTSIFADSSALFESFDSIASTDVWQDAIVRAFKTWTDRIDANVALVSDTGKPFGAPGRTKKDLQFGDVRIGAAPLTSDIIALSVPHDDVVSGTWAGDILFNTNAQLASVDEIFSVAIHEAGHVLGLGHSSDPNSPMYLHGVSDATVPTAQDIANLRKLYGLRLEEHDEHEKNEFDRYDEEHDRDEKNEFDRHDDQHDKDEKNEYDRYETSHHENPHSDSDSAASAIAPVAFRYEGNGTIADVGDVDYLELLPSQQEAENLGYLIIEIRSTKPGKLIASATVLDREGEELKTEVLANANGALVLQAAHVRPDKRHFIKVEAADVERQFLTGSYELTARFSYEGVALAELAAGRLGQENSTRTGTLHVPETMLVHFALAVNSTENPGPSAVWVLIYDSRGQIVCRVAARPGETRSANTVLLTPGQYRTEVHLGVPGNGSLPEVSYDLSALVLSFPVGPGLDDPTNLPINPCCEPGTDPYCSPEDVAVVDPAILYPDLFLEPPLTEPADPTDIPWDDPNLWYWEVPLADDVGQLIL